MSSDLSYQQVEELLEGVLHNHKLVKVVSHEGDRFVILSHAAPGEILLSRHIREVALIEATEEGLPSREDIADVIEERGILGPSEKTRIVELEDKIASQRRLLALTKIEARRAPIRDVISELAEEIVKLESKGSELYTLTREYRADEVALLYLVWAATHTLNKDKYWKTFEDFEAETDLVFRSSVIGEYAVFNQGLSITDIRFLARHILWRIRYTAALKIGGTLFTQELYALTPDQQSLLYWSNFYQSIYEMMPDDQPDDETIQDDEALDAYMEMYFKDREADRNEGKLKRGSRRSGKLAAKESDEVIVTANHPDYLSMVYTDKRVQAGEAESEVEVISPNSRRAKNRRAARRGR